MKSITQTYGNTAPPVLHWPLGLAAHGSIKWIPSVRRYQSRPAQAPPLTPKPPARPRSHSWTPRSRRPYRGGRRARSPEHTPAMSKRGVGMVAQAATLQSIFPSRTGRACDVFWPPQLRNSLQGGQPRPHVPPSVPREAAVEPHSSSIPPRQRIGEAAGAQPSNRKESPNTAALAASGVLYWPRRA